LFLSENVHFNNILENRKVNVNPKFEDVILIELSRFYRKVHRKWWTKCWDYKYRI